jgi:hypothetical protein
VLVPEFAWSVAHATHGHAAGRDWFDIPEGVDAAVVVYLENDDVIELGIRFDARSALVSSLEFHPR